MGSLWWSCIVFVPIGFRDTSLAEAPDIFWSGPPITCKIAENQISCYNLVYFDNNGQNLSPPYDSRACSYWLDYDNIANVRSVALSGTFGDYIRMMQIVSGSNAVVHLDASYSPVAEGVWCELLGGGGVVLEDTVDNLTPLISVVDLYIARNNGSGAPDPAYAPSVRRITMHSDYGEIDTAKDNTSSATYPVAMSAHPLNIDAGSGWQIHTGAPVLEAQYKVTGIAGDNSATNDSLISDAYVAMQLRNNGGEGAGIIFRHQDASNYWELVITGADAISPTIELNKIVAGSPTTVDSEVMTGVNLNSLTETTLRVVVNGSSINAAVFHTVVGDVQWYLSTTDSTFITATRHGFRVTGNVSRLENYYVNSYRDIGWTGYTTTGKYIDSYPTTSAGYYKNELWATPATGSKFTYATFLRIPDQEGLKGYRNLLVGADTMLFFAARNWYNYTDQGADTNRFYVQGKNSSDTGYGGFTDAENIHGIDSGEWLALMFSIDYSASGVPPTVEVWIQRKGDSTATDITPTGADIFYNVNGPITFQFDDATGETVYGKGTINPSYDDYYGAIDYAEVYATDEYVDWSNSAERAKYIDSNGRPVGLGVDGSGLTGTAAKIYLPDGDATDNKGTGGNFTQAGTIPNSTTSPSD